MNELIEGVTALQMAWAAVGLLFGFLLMLPIKRCTATHNGIVSMIIASLMGVYPIEYAWVAVVTAVLCFMWGLFANRKKYIGVATNDTTRA